MLWQQLLVFFLFFLPFSFALNPTESMDLSVVRVLVPLIFGLWLLDSLKNKRLLIDQRPRFWFFLIFLLLSSFSYFWAIDPSRALKKLLFLWPFFLLYFPVYSATNTSQNRQQLAKALLWGSFLASFFGLAEFLLQFILGIDPLLKLISQNLVVFFQGRNFGQLITQYPSWLVNVNGSTLIRAFGSFPDPHLFSLYLNLTAPLGLYLYQKKHSRWYLLMTITILLISLLSFSRAAYLSLAAGGLFLLFFSPWMKMVLAKPWYSLALAGAIVLVLATSNPISQRFFASFDLKEGSNQGRMEMWQKGWQITADYPLTGVGLGNFSRYLEPATAERNPIYAHNLFLDFSSETGLLATLMLILALVSPIAAFLTKPTLLKKMLAASFVILLVHCLFETPFYSVNVFPLIITLLGFRTDNAIS